MKISLTVKVRTTGEGYQRSHVVEVYRGAVLLSHACRAVTTGDGALDTARVALMRAGVGGMRDGSLAWYDGRNVHAVDFRIDC